MKLAPKDVTQALSLPCRCLELGLSDELGPSDGARASRRAASASGPTLARTQSPRLPPLKHPGNPTSKQPSNLPQPVFPGGNTAKVCQKTHNSDRFLPTLNSTASKKFIENKDTIG